MQDSQRSDRRTATRIAPRMRAALLGLLAGLPGLAGAQTFTAAPGEVAIAGDGTVTLRVTVQHPEGAAAVRQVAAEVTGAGANAAFPTLYDDGTHGDSAPGDGEFALAAVLPEGEGVRTVIFYAVDQSGVEVITEPSTFVLE